MNTVIPSEMVLPRNWVCAQSCGSEARTYDASLPHHRCREVGGLMVALIPVGTRAGVTTHERQDYTGHDVVTYTDGKVIMSTTVEHDDGNDTTVYAPCATGTQERGSVNV